MLWPKTGATINNAQLGLSDKELVVCWMLSNLMPQVFRLLKGHWLR